MSARSAAAAALLVLCSCGGRVGHATEDEGLSNRTAEFIDGLKLVLRKNNDDYAEVGTAARRRTDDRDRLRHAPVTGGSVRADDEDLARRRPDHGRGEDASPADLSSGAPLSTNRRYENRTQTKKKRAKNTIKKEERLQHFLKKNEGLIRDYLSSRNMQSKSPSTSSSVSLSSSNTPPLLSITPSSPLFSPDHKGPSRYFSISSHLQFTSPSALLSPPALLATPSSSGSSWEDQERGPLAVRQLVRPRESLLHEVVLPEPDQLDMAPASGAKIHNLRIKGRLCQRSVLFPEGPKYDSNGKAYIRSHDESIAHRDFASTRRPKYILPRCCNCCKKSVLGCE